jgi:O-methyltransferase domain
MISPCRSYHLIDGIPMYKNRFDIVLPFHEPGLAPVKRNGLAWHINPSGEPSYTERFLNTFGFYCSVAAVQADMGWFHINSSGKAIYSAIYSWCGNYQEDISTVRTKEGRYFHINLDGSKLYSNEWKYVGDFRKGIAVVQGDNGLSSHIDKDGNIVHDHWFLDLDIYHKGFARAQDRTGWFHIDLNGEPIYNTRFSMVEPFYNGQARVETLDGTLQVINQSGDVLQVLRPTTKPLLQSLSTDMVGYWRTFTLMTAVKLGIPDALPCSIDSMSATTGVPEKSLSRLLNALHEMDIVSFQNDKYSLTSKGLLLQTTHPYSMAGAAMEYGEHLLDLWRDLPQALLNPTKWVRPQTFKDAVQNENRITNFHSMLASYALQDYRELVPLMKIREGATVIDAAGGVGVLTTLIADAYTDIQVLLLEMPEVIPLVIIPKHLQTRVELHPFNLFEPWDVSGDAVVLARILHDWDDDEVVHILRNARKCLPLGGELFLIEMVLEENSSGGGLCDLHLLVTTGGKERTLKEFKQLLAIAGFSLDSCNQTTGIPSLLKGVAK